MPVENEAKFAVPSHDEVRERLRANSAERIGRVVETNSIYDWMAPDAAPESVGALRRRGAALRVRSVEVLDGPDRPATVTFKGPVEAGAFKKRAELELPLIEAEGMRGLLEAIGFVEMVRFEKRRESWRLGGCLVELDELPRLGCFVEIEGPDDAAIERTRESLGLSVVRLVQQSYAGLIVEAFAKEIQSRRPIEFPSA
jgi:adenylate cyclase class 2